MAVSLGVAGSFTFPATGVRAKGTALLLAIDDAAFPLRRNLCYYLTKPKVRKEPVLAPSRDNPNAPDYLAAHFYGTVLLDQGKLRMWYYPCHLGRNPDWPPKLRAQAERWRDAAIPGPLCYAESADGIHWEKPNLGQLLFKGSRSNNALDLPSALTGDACVIKDEEDPDPARRYKLAFWTQYDPWDYPTMRTATSPDGLRWRAASAGGCVERTRGAVTAPEPPIHAFLEHASFYEHNGLYFANSQAFLAGEGGRERGRQGAAWVSPDFDHWLQECGESFALPAAPGPRRDEVHLGVGAASFGSVLAGLYCIWHNDAVFGKISGDLGLVVSNDGIAFREPVKGHVFLSTADSPATPAPGKEYPTVLCQANGILNVADETRIYHGRWRNAGSASGAKDDDYYAEVALATLPRDRWGALGLVPGQSEGSVWTGPVRLPEDGCRVLLNADDADGMRVEVADERFQPFPGFSGDDAGRPTSTGGLSCPVAWGASGLQALGGRTVRLRVHLNKAGQSEPRLYAVYLESAAPTGAQGAQPAYRSEEFTLSVGDRQITARVLAPTEGRLAADPALLLIFATDRATSLLEEPYCLAARFFLERGHRVASFDLPQHGERVDAFGEGIVGFRNAFVAGGDPFAGFVEEGRAVVDECVRRGWARPGRIAVCGTSRGGYMALRLLAGDARIAAGAGFAPVTDWRYLSEFAQDRGGMRRTHPWCRDVADLRLSRLVDGLAGKAVYLAIGSDDARVNTASCQGLYRDLLQAKQRSGRDPSEAALTLTPDAGHSLGQGYYRRGSEFLLAALGQRAETR